MGVKLEEVDGGYPHDDRHQRRWYAGRRGEGRVEIGRCAERQDRDTKKNDVNTD